MAGTAFLLIVTAMLLPWWAITNETSGTNTLLGRVFLFGSNQDLVHPLAKGATAVLLAAAAILLFLRVAAAEWRHDAHRWRRDLRLGSLLVFIALASCVFWPLELPFWGGRTYALVNGTVVDLTIVAQPGLGWWTAGIALGLLGWASWIARSRDSRQG